MSDGTRGFGSRKTEFEIDCYSLSNQNPDVRDKLSQDFRARSQDAGKHS